MEEKNEVEKTENEVVETVESEESTETAEAENEVETVADEAAADETVVEETVADEAAASETVEDEAVADEAAADDSVEVRASLVFPVYSVVMIAFIVAVFGAQLYYDVYGGGLRGVPSVYIAGLVKADLDYGEYWRLLTSEVLHGSIVHIALNMFAFFSIGRLFETLSNRAHLAIVFVLSAIGASLVSYSFMTGTSPSIGASGALCGLLGYLTVYGYFRRKLLSSSFLNNMLLNIVVIAIIGIGVNYSRQQGGPMIDNFAHLGGLLAGALYGLVQIPADTAVDPREVSGTTELAGTAAFGIVIATCIFTIGLLLGWV